MTAQGKMYGLREHEAHIGRVLEFCEKARENIRLCLSPETDAVTHAAYDALNSILYALRGRPDISEAAALITTLQQSLSAKDAEIERLREALNIYADDESWLQGGVCDPETGNFEGQNIARAALQASQ